MRTTPPTRRPFLPTVAALAAALLTSCGVGTTTDSGTGTATPSAAPPSTSAPRTIVMLIRHAEKPVGTEPGVDAHGNEDDSSLTEVGWDRAYRLTDVFDPATGSPRPGLARPAAIYAAGANDDGDGERTRETVAPLAARLGIPVNTSFGKGNEHELVEHVAAQPGPTLIAWQHGEIPVLAKAFPSVTPTPPAAWPDDRFDVIWTFTKTVDGWHFAQVPELLVPQDRSSPIKD